MNWRRPSLSHRLALSFICSFAVLTAGMVLIALLSIDTSHAGVHVAASTLAEELRPGPGGRLTVLPGGRLSKVVMENPNFWALAKNEGGDTLSIGDPPRSVRILVEAAPDTLSQTSALDFETTGPKGASPARLEIRETSFGSTLLAVGGVSNGDLGTTSFVSSIWAAAAIVAIPLLVVLGAVLWLLLVPLIMKGIRPLAAEAAGIDGSDPTRRLSEQGVLFELLPLVQAFNGALARLEEMLERRRRFVADAAHELRTPLAILTLEIEALPPTSARDRLQRTLFRHSQIVGQMLDVERVRGPGVRNDPVDLVLVSREAVTEIAPLALKAGYEVSFSFEAPAVHTSGDRHAIRRAIVNLLSNSVAHGGGSGTIDLRVSSNASIEVTDEGPGVLEAERGHIFEPFHRIHWDRDGCGLGLHLVSETMRAHGGTAELVRELTSGARFRLNFPLSSEGVEV